MKFNNYKLNKLYSIKTLKHYWFTKEKHGVVTFIKDKKYVMFIQKPYISNYFISKINCIRRSIIKAHIIYDIIDKYLKKHDFGFPELKRLVISYVGFNDTRYFYSDNDYEKKNNNLNYSGVDNIVISDECNRHFE